MTEADAERGGPCSECRKREDEDMNEEPKLCATCAHCRKDGEPYAWWCGNPELGPRISLVTGELQKLLCSVQRDHAFDAVSKCGSEGKLWEAKQ